MELSGRHKRISDLRPVIIILFSFFLVMNMANLLFVIAYSSSDFFTATVISHFSIYSSRLFFLIHCLLSISICAAILYLIIKKQEHRSIPYLMFIYMLLFLYPLLAG